MQEGRPPPRGAAFRQRHGRGQAEAEWTCALAARGVEVFGQNPGDLCPGKAWRDAAAGWGANWQNPRTWTLCIDAAGRVTTALV